MTRNVFLFFSFLAGAAASIPCSFATGDSPVVQGLGGGGRVGVPRESLFGNPAAVAAVKETFAFMHYALPRVDDFNASGRSYNVGVYDGGDKTWKGGFGYTRISAARISADGTQTYVDRSEYRFATGHYISNGVTGGMGGRMIRNHSQSDKRFLETDFGVTFPFFSEIRAGATLENAFDREAEHPRTVGVGANYPLMAGTAVYADGYRIMQGPKKGSRGWSLAAELALSGDFVARGSLFQDALRRMKGWTAGLSWAGPRASFDYVMRTTGKGPRERDHIFGMTSLF